MQTQSQALNIGKKLALIKLLKTSGCPKPSNTQNIHRRSSLRIPIEKAGNGARDSVTDKLPDIN